MRNDSSFEPVYDYLAQKSNYEELKRMILANIRRHVASPALCQQWAEEILSDLYVTALDKKASYDPTKGSVRIWLCGFIKNLVLRKQDDTRRDNQRTVSMDTYVPPVDEAIPSGELRSKSPTWERLVLTRQTMTSFADQIARKDLIEHLKSGLLEEERRLFTLAFEEEHSHDEVASILKINPGNVRVRISRLRTKLKQREQQEENPYIGRQVGELRSKSPGGTA